MIATTRARRRRLVRQRGTGKTCRDADFGKPVFSAEDLKRLGFPFGLVGTCALVPPGRLSEWKEKVVDEAALVLLSAGNPVPQGSLRLVTEKEINRAKNAGALFKLFPDTIAASCDGHRKIYQLMLYLSEDKGFFDDDARLGRPSSPNARRTRVTYKLPPQMVQEVERLKAQTRSTEPADLIAILKGLDRLEKSPDRYGHIVFPRLKGHDATSLLMRGVRLSDEHLERIDKVRRPGEANQALIRRLISIALAASRKKAKA